MTENKLEGFEDFENILGDADSGGDAELSGGLDDILGDSGGAPPGTAMEEGDSELDSFFEDLSTIDDLEVLQDEEEMVPAPEGPMEQAHADEDEEEEEEYEPAPAVQKEKAKPAKAAKPAKEKTGPGFITRTFKRIVLLTLLAVVGYAAYWVFTLVFFSEGEAPKEWGVEEVVKDVEKAVKELTPPEKPPVAEAPPELPPEPPPQLEPEPPPRPKPRPRPAIRPKAAPQGKYSIQVALCLFDSCVETYTRYLESKKYSTKVTRKTVRSEAFEIFSGTAFNDKEEAQDFANRINREHSMEGHAYIFREKGSHHISLGGFPDLNRANGVRDALNERYAGEVFFTIRLTTLPYKLRSVSAGSYATRREADKHLRRLRSLDSRFKGAFIVTKK